MCYLLHVIGSLQISLLLHFSFPYNSNSMNGEKFQNQMSSVEEVFNWLSILWERGLCHDNPQGTSTLLVMHTMQSVCSKHYIITQHMAIWLFQAGVLFISSSHFSICTYCSQVFNHAVIFGNWVEEAEGFC